MNRREYWIANFHHNLVYLEQFGIDETWLEKSLKLESGKWAKLIGFAPNNSAKPMIVAAADGTCMKMSITTYKNRIENPKF